MKNFSLISSKVIFFLALFFILNSCSNNDTEIAYDKTPIKTETILRLKNLGYNVDGIIKKDNGYLVEGDLFITDADISSMEGKDSINISGPRGEQYRVYNIVNVNGYRYINVALGSGASLPLQIALENAKTVINSLNRSIIIGKQSRSSPVDITINNIANGYEVGGAAGPPINGNPFPTITFFHQTHIYNQQVINHVILHELLHCLGFRHSDWQTRSSCNPGGAEVRDPDGAELIPGTPANDPSSIMLACFNGSESGNLSSFDQIAFNALYAARPCMGRACK